MPSPGDRERLNAPLIYALMRGANIGSLSELAERTGSAASQLSRALRGETVPSIKMLRGLSELWPKVTLGELLGDPDATYEHLRIRRQDVAALIEDTGDADSDAGTDSP